jgi:hypothetical protein
VVSSAVLSALVCSAIVSAAEVCVLSAPEHPVRTVAVMAQANKVAIVFFMKSFLSFRIQLFRQKPWEYFAPFSFCFVSSRLVRIPFYSIIKSKKFLCISRNTCGLEDLCYSKDERYS